MRQCFSIGFSVTLTTFHIRQRHSLAVCSQNLITKSNSNNNLKYVLRFAKALFSSLLTRCPSRAGVIIVMTYASLDIRSSTEGNKTAINMKVELFTKAGKLINSADRDLFMFVEEIARNIALLLLARCRMR